MNDIHGIADGGGLQGKAQATWDASWKQQQAKRTSFRRLYRWMLPKTALFNYYLCRWLEKNLDLSQIRLLEVGGGGGLGLLLMRHVNAYSLLDYSPQALEHAREVLGPSHAECCILGDLFKWQPPEPYDLVFSMGLLEHFFTPEEQLRVVQHHARLTSRYVGIAVPADTPHNWSMAIRFRQTGQFPPERPMNERQLLDLCQQADLIPRAISRLDPGYGTFSTLRYLTLAIPVRLGIPGAIDHGLNRNDGGVLILLAEKKQA